MGERIVFMPIDAEIDAETLAAVQDAQLVVEMLLETMREARARLDNAVALLQERQTPRGGQGPFLQKLAGRAS
jgi:hypothetical protein